MPLVGDYLETGEGEAMQKKEGKGWASRAKHRGRQGGAGGYGLKSPASEIGQITSKLRHGIMTCIESVAGGS